MTAVGGGNNIIAELPTTVSRTVECVRRWGPTGKPALIKRRFPRVQDMERYVSRVRSMWKWGCNCALTPVRCGTNTVIAQRMIGRQLSIRDRRSRVQPRPTAGTRHDRHRRPATPDPQRNDPQAATKAAFSCPVPRAKIANLGRSTLTPLHPVSNFSLAHHHQDRDIKSCDHMRQPRPICRH